MGRHSLCYICLPWTGDTSLHLSFSSLPSSLLSFLLFFFLINANDFFDLLSELLDNTKMFTHSGNCITIQ